jgi:hypothetical protein
MTSPRPGSTRVFDVPARRYRPPVASCAHTEQTRRDILRGTALDLNLLREFVHLTDTGSLSQSATHLGYTPAALTHRVTALEQALGARLLIHGPRGVRPTARGARLLPYLRITLITIDILRQRPSTDRPTTGLPD